jgi:hypothetical protein
MKADQFEKVEAALSSTELEKREHEVLTSWEF